MLSRPATEKMWRVLGAVLLFSVAGWVGCGTPQEKYKVLSFFFDGVPNPDAVAAKKAEKDGRLGEGSPSVVQLAIVSRHKPYVDNKCDACHRTERGEIADFSAAYKVCGKCHVGVEKKYRKMHGPVANGGCEWCHTGHDASYPALLKDSPIKVCTQCHDQQLLGPTPPQHSDGVTSCISCHTGHGGEASNFLKAGWKGEWPKGTPEAKGAATAPATQSRGAP